jgi:hypothetical protein
MFKRLLVVSILLVILLAVPAQAQFTCHITIVPSYTSRGLSTIRSFTIYVQDGFGNPVPYCPLQIELLPVANSYGHQHTNPTRPIGALSITSGNTGADGLQFRPSYTAPDVSGQVILRATGDPPGATCQDGTPVPSTDFGLCIENSGLLALPAGTTYTLTGQTATHPVNHYGTAAMVDVLQALADSFYVASGSVMLGINDISLVKGGLFDYQATWVPPHSSHRLGVDADIDLPTKSQRRLFLSLVAKFQLRRIVEPGPLTHYHLRMN